MLLRQLSVNGFLGQYGHRFIHWYTCKLKEDIIRNKNATLTERRLANFTSKLICVVNVELFNLSVVEGSFLITRGIFI